MQFSCFSHSLTIKIWSICSQFPLSTTKTAAKHIGLNQSESEHAAGRKLIVGYCTVSQWQLQRWQPCIGYDGSMLLRFIPILINSTASSITVVLNNQSTCHEIWIGCNCAAYSIMMQQLLRSSFWTGWLASSLWVSVSCRLVMQPVAGWWSGQVWVTDKNHAFQHTNYRSSGELLWVTIAELIRGIPLDRMWQQLMRASSCTMNKGASNHWQLV